MTGKQLIQWRQHMGDTQQDAAKALDMTQPNYSNMERRQQVNRRTELACMALAANLSAARWPWE